MNKLDSAELVNYILAKSRGASHLKLQKLIYYIEAYHLAILGSSIIDDEFEAWLHGPVSRKLYSKLVGIGYANDPIKLKGDPGEVIEKIVSQLNTDQVDLINDVLDEFGNKSGYRLECLTHEELPWKEARRGYTPSQNCKEVISKDTMKTYYSSLIYGEEA